MDFIRYIVEVISCENKEFVGWQVYTHCLDRSGEWEFPKFDPKYFKEIHPDGSPRSGEAGGQIKNP